MSRTITFTVWDAANNQPKTGDAANLTLRLKIDAAAPTALTNSPSEPDSTNAPGEYAVALTAAEEASVDAARDAKLVGTSSSSDCHVIPVFLQGTVRLANAAHGGTSATLTASQIKLEGSHSGEGVLHLHNTHASGFGLYTEGYNGLYAKGSQNGMYLEGTVNGMVATGSTNDIYGDLAGSVDLVVGGVDLNADQSGVTIGVVSSLTGHTPQTGDGYGILSHAEYGNAALKGLVDAVDSVVDVLAARLSAARAGYLDNLNVGGLVASQSDVSAITQAARVRVVAPPQIERPDTGSVTYRVWIYAYNSQHQAEDLDDVPVVAAVNNAEVDRSANLSAVTRDSLGVYYTDYTVADDHAVEGLVFKVDATEAGVTTRYAGASLVVDTTAVDYTTADRARDDAAKAILDLLPDGGALSSLGTVVNQSTLLGRLTDARAGYLDKLDVAGTLAHTGNASSFQADVADLATSAAVAAVQAAVDLVKTTTDQLGGLVEDDGTGADRFSAKALEEAPAGTVEGALDWTPTQKATILEQLAKIDARIVTVRAALDADENLTLVEGDDYTAGSVNGALTWTREDYAGPSLDGQTGTLRIMPREGYQGDAEVAAVEVDVAVAQLGSTVTMTCDLAASDLTALDSTTPPSPRHSYRYQVVVTLGETTATLKRGYLTLEKQIEAPASGE